MTWTGKRPTVWGSEVTAMSKRVFVRTAQKALTSVQFGLAETGSPGQPVDLGILRASWILAFEASGLAIISTNVVYAPGIEEGIGPYGPIQLRSQVGGFHSVQLTVAGFQRLVNAAVEEEKRLSA